MVVVEVLLESPDMRGSDRTDVSDMLRACPTREDIQPLPICPDCALSFPASLEWPFQVAICRLRDFNSLTGDESAEYLVDVVSCCLFCVRVSVILESSLMADAVMGEVDPPSLIVPDGLRS